MGNDRPIIETVTFTAEPNRPKRRVRKVDWLKVLAELDQKPGEWALIGVFDRSVRTHIAKGRYEYIDPNLYETTTTTLEDGPKNLGHLFMRRRVAST